MMSQGESLKASVRGAFVRMVKGKAGGAATTGGTLRLRSGQAARRSIDRMLSIVRAMLREIFDEAAYGRFLERRRLRTSSEAYAEFLLENEARQQRRPRCC